MRGIQIAVGVIVTGLLAMTGVGSGASANLAWWLDKGGFTSAARWLSQNGDALLAPWAIVTLIFVALACFFGPWIARRFQRQPSVLRPDTPIHEAIDYIVNDSKVKLKHPGAPFRMESGPAAGQIVAVAGVEHEDARLRLHAKLRFGDLQAWGNREIAGAPPETVDDTSSEIKKDFWEQAAPHPLHCFHNSSLVQTLRLGNTANPPRYWHLTLNSKQVRSGWPRKPPHARLAAWIRRRTRISFWQHHDTR